MKLWDITRRSFRTALGLRPPVPAKWEPSMTFQIGGGWGNAVNWFDLDKLRVVGWQSRRPNVGDGLLAEMVSGRTYVYRFVAVDYKLDPPDMFFGTVKAVCYLDDLKVAK